ncbi:SGNH/GDSL hydrolase family protein [Pedobacter sp. MC2016-14]|uniref:SGNH/GDSL hydrolase family protein n=1 Tax=Pedobacter sp. MC2016-14 TaxID=2897327 RepID=UPI001E33A1D9|nr:SGNH/GDSL hydrolase family protein [Pedobacter sp. MC2016-14]MCD0490346.1 SGNH/GDSL hydrolase family protein [Pedobacter sp. MC2016-14]
MQLKSAYLLLLTTSLLYFPCHGMAQTNPFSQENAEQQALQKYEAAHPPLDSMRMPAPGAHEAFFGARIMRSASLLANSSKDKHLPVKILIYGQSIVGSTLFTQEINKYIKEKFPFAEVTLENRAIGGFGGEQIVRTAVHDVYPFNPDLIIFHVYGGEKAGELEQLFSGIRRYTNADVILMGHHLNATQTKPDDNQTQFIRYIANKYDCELADISAEWPTYLAANNLKPTDLLRDGVHPNRNGNWLLAQLVGRHIRYNPLFPSLSYKMVRSYYPVTAFDFGITNPIALIGKSWKNIGGAAVSDSKDSRIKFSFTGNRVDVVSGHPANINNTGNALVLLDGKPIEGANMVYAITRPSSGVGTWWPAVRQVSNVKPLIEEEWTLRVETINADSTVFTYSVKGSKTGEDGIGNNTELFISRSGRVVIQADDIMFTRIRKTFKVSTPKDFEVKWSVVPLFKSKYQPPLGKDKAKIYKATLVQGLSNGPHTLEIVPLGDGPIPIESFEVYEPSLK